MIILRTLLLLIISSPLVAQSPFEGKISYTVTTYEKSENGLMIIYFGKPGVRVEFRDPKNPETIQEALIINFDSASTFTLHSSKTYKTSPLKRAAQVQRPAAKEIAGFKTTPVSMESSTLSGNLAGIIGSSVLYPADDLFYPVPESYAAAPELLMINRGKVVLGGDFYFPTYPDDDWPTDKAKDSTIDQHKVFSVVANEVVRQPIDPALFVVPADYTSESTNYSTDPYLKDSMDSVSVLSKKPGTKTKKKLPKKSSTYPKQNATRRKSD